MDLVKVLNDAIERLPEGDHSLGLQAVMRHISVAIKHFERRSENETDSFTDAVYRTNQAYEGSLKEAYRVLARKDPSKKGPNEIEQYLEGNKIVRPRVLTQLSRYRQDYRNPSTHDHKLDFDQSEAILAIVAVCAFAKLLIDQISERLVFEAAAAAPPPEQAKSVDLENPASFISAINAVALAFANEADPSLTYFEFEGGLAGRLTSLGLNVEVRSVPSHVGNFNWDIAVFSNTLTMSIETRLVSKELDDSEAHGFTYLARGVKSLSYSGGLVIMISAGNNPYELYKAIVEDQEIHIITRYGTDDIEKIERGIARDLSVI